MFSMLCGRLHRCMSVLTVFLFVCVSVSTLEPLCVIAMLSFVATTNSRGAITKALHKKYSDATGFMHRITACSQVTELTHVRLGFGIIESSRYSTADGASL